MSQLSSQPDVPIPCVHIHFNDCVYLPRECDEIVHIPVNEFKNLSFFGLLTKLRDKILQLVRMYDVNGLYLNHSYNNIYIYLDSNLTKPFDKLVISEDIHIYYEIRGHFAAQITSDFSVGIYQVHYPIANKMAQIHFTVLPKNSGILSNGKTYDSIEDLFEKHIEFVEKAVDLEKTKEILLESWMNGLNRYDICGVSINAQ